MLMPPGVQAALSHRKHCRVEVGLRDLKRLAIGGDGLRAPIAKDAPVLDETLGEWKRVVGVVGGFRDHGVSSCEAGTLDHD